MKTPLPLFRLLLALALALPAALLRAQEPATPAPTVEPTPAVEPAVAPAEPAVAPDEPEPALRELGEGAETPPAEPTPPPRGRASRAASGSQGPPIGNQRVDEAVKQREAVAILGNATVDGHVTQAAVSVLGNTTVNGRVDGEAVSVLGTTTINGSVGREAVAVFGDVVLGPGAEVGGEAVAVFGKVVRGEGAVVRGNVTEVAGFGKMGDFAWLKAYFQHCLRWGRPLWFGENLGWAWAVAAGFLFFYMLLALLFPRGIERCAGLLEEKPGSTVLATVLTALLTPLLLVLLIMTGVGIILVPFLAAGLFFAALFGKAVILAWFGRRITGFFGEGPLRHAVAAVFFGGLIVAALYLVPFLGFLLYKLFGVLGLGVVIYALILAMQQERANRTPAVAAASGSAASVAPGLGVVPGMEAAPVPPVALPPPAAQPPVVISAATLPRVGFWLRLAAGLLDFVIIGIALGLFRGIFRVDLDGPGALFFGLAAYSAMMWKSRGTTIGGVVCGLKVVRTDDRPIDWTIAIVRALSAFLSFAVAGLGFIWVAFDSERQSWHDKIAGTTIVKVPKGVSLL